MSAPSFFPKHFLLWTFFGWLLYHSSGGPTSKMYGICLHGAHSLVGEIVINWISTQMNQLHFWSKKRVILLWSLVTSFWLSLSIFSLSLLFVWSKVCRSKHDLTVPTWAEIILTFNLLAFSSVQFISVVSDSLWPHGLQHARLPCPSPTPRAFSNSYPSNQWCHPTISSSVIPFSSCLQSFQHQGLF